MRYPVEIRLVPSRRALFLVAAIHLIAAIAFLLSALPWAVRILALIALSGSLFMALRAEQAKAAFLIVLENSGMLAVRGETEIMQAAPERDCADFGWAVWLQWRTCASPEARRRPTAMMLLPDNLPAGLWRVLRIWLKHKALVPGKPDASSLRESG